MTPSQGSTLVTAASPGSGEPLSPRQRLLLASLAQRALLSLWHFRHQPFLTTTQVPALRSEGSGVAQRWQKGTQLSSLFPPLGKGQDGFSRNNGFLLSSSPETGQRLLLSGCLWACAGPGT